MHFVANISCKNNIQHSTNDHKLHNEETTVIRKNIINNVIQCLFSNTVALKEKASKIKSLHTQTSQDFISILTSHTSDGGCFYLFIAVVVFLGFLLLFLLLLILLLLLVLVGQDVIQPGQIMLREDQVQSLPHDHQAQNLTEEPVT